MKFEGIYTPVITPFQEDLSINEKGYAEVIENQIALGTHGIVIGGTTGENYALTPEERIWQFKFANEVIANRVPWIAGVNDIRTEDVCGYSVAAKENGADALLLAVPPYSIPTDDELAEHALEVDKAADLPIMLYSYPGRSGTCFGEDFLKQVADKPNFQAIKESSGDIDRVHLLACQFPQLQLSCGADDQALEFFAWGAQSWVCAAGNFMATEAIALHKACVLESDFAKGRRIAEAMLPVMTVLERGGKFVQCVKYGCELVGLPTGSVRRPLRPLGEELKTSMREALETAKVAFNKIIEA